MHKAFTGASGMVTCALAVVGVTGCSSSSWFHPHKPTISVSASVLCPTSLGPARDVADHSGGSTTLLPTSGAPSAAVVCSYKNRDLIAQAKLGARRARDLASVVDKIDLSAPHGNFNCPAKGDDVAIMAFRFVRTDDVDLWWDDSGCQTLDNGRLGAFEGANPSFYEAFQSAYSRLVPSMTATAQEQPKNSTVRTPQS